jgi:hypothetical protein
MTEALLSDAARSTAYFNFVLNPGLAEATRALVQGEVPQMPPDEPGQHRLRRLANSIAVMSLEQRVLTGAVTDEFLARKALSEDANADRHFSEADFALPILQEAV